MIGCPRERRKGSFGSPSDDNLRISALDSFGSFNERIGTAYALGNEGARAPFYAKENAYVALRTSKEPRRETMEAHCPPSFRPEVLYPALKIHPPGRIRC